MTKEEIENLLSNENTKIPFGTKIYYLGLTFNHPIKLFNNIDKFNTIEEFDMPTLIKMYVVFKCFKKRIDKSYDILNRVLIDDIINDLKETIHNKINLAYQKTKKHE